jgi:hypothetical protein
MVVQRDRVERLSRENDNDTLIESLSLTCASLTNRMKTDLIIQGKICAKLDGVEENPIKT